MHSFAQVIIVSYVLRAVQRGQQKAQTKHVWHMDGSHSEIELLE